VPIRITVSYRRSDSPYASRGIRARFAEHFGKENVFMDIDSIALGVDYRKPIAEALAKTDVVAVVIGPKWFGQRESGKPRLFDSNDPVRYEVAAALSVERILVVPLLVDGATMPGEEELPESLKELAYRNATPIDSGRDFEAHVDRVIRSIEYWRQGELNENQGLVAEEGQGRQLAEAAERQQFDAASEQQQFAASEAKPPRPGANETERQRVGAPTERQQVAAADKDAASRQKNSVATVGGRTLRWILLILLAIAFAIGQLRF
jgi:hypothetical protein